MNHFFDIGANVGQTFRGYLLQHPKYDGWTVWCFEPSPRCLPTLMSEAAKYGDRYKINICPFGLDGKRGVRRFYQKNDTVSDSMWLNHGINELHRYDIFIAPQVISEFVEQQTTDGDRIEIKLDAEGAEYAILANLLTSSPALRRIDRIMVEWHQVGDYASRADLQQSFHNLGIPLEDCPV